MSNQKKHHWHRRVGVLALAIMMVLSLAFTAACDNGGDEEPETTYYLADPQWDSVQFHNSVASIILNNGYNIATEVTSGSTPITWQALVSGEIQIYMEVWSDNLSYYQDDLDSGEIIECGTNFDDNAQGFYVPRYLIEGDEERGIEAVAPDLKNIHDLADNPELYTEVFADPDDPGMGRVYGSPPGWEVDQHLRAKMEAYGLNDNYNYFSPGSDASLAASLAAAYEAGEAWCGYYWEPTWVSGLFDIVLLEDDPFTTNDDTALGLNEFPANDVTICVNKIVEEQNPEVVEMLSRYTTSSALTAEALSYMKDNEATTDEAAAWFLNTHQDLLEQWVDDSDRVEKILDAIAE